MIHVEIYLLRYWSAVQVVVDNAKKSSVHSYLDGGDRLQTYAFLVRFG
jgi:hypothetical protein